MLNFTFYQRYKTCSRFPILALVLVAILCLCLPSPSQASPPPLMAHAGWQRLDSLVDELPFTWARRYLELKSIAEDADDSSRHLPFQLQRLREVTLSAQRAVVNLLLDMVPAQANVQETSYILGLLRNWSWKLDLPLHRTAGAAAGLQHSLQVLTDIGQAIAEMQASTQKRPIMEKTGQDFYDLYTLVLRRVQETNTNLNSIRSVALEIYKQIENTTILENKNLPAKWLAYYTSPLVVSRSGFSRLDMNVVTLYQNLTYDEGFPSGVPFALLFNTLLIFSIILAHAALVRTANTSLRIKNQHTFTQSLCCEFHNLSKKHKFSFAICLVVMLNTILDALPQLHEGIPFLFIPQMFMTVALAIWARTSSKDPDIWELSMSLMVGQLLLHGDAVPALMLLGMGGALLITLCGLLRKRKTRLSSLRVVWLAALLLSLLLVSLGFGRLTVPLLMLILVLKASASMLSAVNSSQALQAYTLARACFVSIFTFYLCFMSVSFLIGCPGLGALHIYWSTNAVPIMGFSVTSGDVILFLFFMMGIGFASNISRQILENLGRESHVLDASAVPVLHVMINCLLAGIFGFFVVSSLGMDVTSLAFIGGGVSIGIGFAAKTILSNFFCGLVIVCSKVVRAGDIVEINSIRGQVLSVNMRATVVETDNHSILLVPNEQLLCNHLTNWSLNNKHVREDISVCVEPESDMSTALEAMEKAAKSVSGVMKTPSPEAYFAGFGENTMELVLKIWVYDIQARVATLSEVRKALRKTLTEQGVVLSMLVARRLDVNVHEQHAGTKSD